ncbi:MAG: endo alpha-1,4 polygalactosaminidase [Calditerrivibrio sp.]|nr:endo alpha-1,4 polygalactosaminidase [Calditerrivibrio sp.]
MILNMKPIVLLISFLTLYNIASASIFDNLTCGIAFYYKKEPPRHMTALYDYIVVNPDHIEKIDKKYIAYLSVGEINPVSNDYNMIKKDWIIGKNDQWKSYITDLANPAYKDFLIQKAASIQKKGFSGLFLDTLDSYQLIIKDEGQKKIFEQHLTELIIELKNRFPDLYILINRGFEILDTKMKDYIDAVVVESYLTSYDFKQKKYTEQTEEGKRWLENKFSTIKSLNKPIIVIEYTEDKAKKQRKVLAKNLLDKGLIPFVSNIDLDSFGISLCEHYPRKILTIYSKESSKDTTLTSAHRLFSIPLEYYGYYSDYLDPNESPLPDRIVDEYIGIIVKLEDDRLNKEEEFYKWIKKQIENGIKVLFINYFGFEMNEDKQRFLNLKITPNTSTENTYTIVYADKSGNFETKINTYWGGDLYETDGNPLLLLKNAKNEKHAPIAITSWGGYALSEMLYTSYPEEMWVFDPFSFIKNALRLPTIPAPDVTTENGRRVFISHIDGDGFTEVALFNKKRYTSEIIRDEIIKKYNLPIAVSIIEGEISEQIKKSTLFEEIAKSIFRLDNVEIANHSYSHPFKWKAMEKFEQTQAYNLTIDGYKFDLEREIKGSTQYINEKLAPKDKKTSIFLWTGDCNPTENAIKLVYENNLLNMNGGGSIMTNLSPYLSKNFPIGIKKGDLYQIYAPNQNENVYTNLWTSNFYGYKNVIQTFKLTDTPKRIKPINVYYHFYSGSKLSSLNALKEAYNYATSQKITPMFPSQYIKRALDFYSTLVAKEVRSESWIIKTSGDLKTLKIPTSENVEPIINSSSVGFSDHNDMIYIHLSNSNTHRIQLGKNSRQTPYLKEANGIITSYKYTKTKRFYRISGYTNLEVVLKNVINCSIRSNKVFSKSTNMDETLLKFNSNEVDIEIECT